jgi:hypothetical protein
VQRGAALSIEGDSASVLWAGSWGYRSHSVPQRPEQLDVGASDRYLATLRDHGSVEVATMVLPREAVGRGGATIVLEQWDSGVGRERMGALREPASCTPHHPGPGRQ